MNEKKMESLSNIDNLAEIDTLSILSKNLQQKYMPDSQALGLSESTRSNNQQRSQHGIVLEESEMESLEVNDGDSKELDMSFLVVEGLEIARRQSKRDNQINSIVPKFRENCLVLSEQLHELTSHVEMAILTQEETHLKKRIKQLLNFVLQLKNQESKPAPKVFISTRRYISPKNISVHNSSRSKIEEKRVQELTTHLRKKKQEFLKNKLKLEQLAWQHEKLQRKSRIRDNNKNNNRPSTLRTVSKKKPIKNQSEQKIGFRRLRPSDASFKKLSVNNKDLKKNPYLQRDVTNLKRQDTSCKKEQTGDKSDLRDGESMWTQEEAKKQFLIRRLKILKQSITLYEGTFSKIISQIQLECKLLTKQIDCFEDELTVNTYMLQKSDISKTNNNLQNITTSNSNIQQNREKHSKSISPPPSSKSRLVKCNSQNLRKLALSNQRKLSSYLLNKSRDSLATCKKIRIKSAHEEDSKSRESSKLKEYQSPDTIKQSSEKKQELIMEEYFQKENKFSRKNQASIRNRQSPKLRFF